MKNMQIIVTTARTRHDTPLMVLNGGPFNDTELTPDQARFLCAALMGTADAVAEDDVTGRHWRPRRIVIGDATGNAALDHLNPEGMSAISGTRRNGKRVMPPAALAVILRAARPDSANRITGRQP